MTNNASERLFSHCANFYIVKQTFLRLNKLEQLVVIKLNSDLCKTIDLFKFKTEKAEKAEENENLNNIV